MPFHQFQKNTGDRIRYLRVNERTSKEVDFADIVKGAEVGKDKYVMLEPGELDDIAPGRSRSLEIHTFVSIDEIDPMYFQKTYYLGPGSKDTAKTYALLRDAMEDAGRAAIGTLVMRGKEYLVAIRPDNSLLVLETMFFADEVRDPKDVMDSVPGRSKAKPAEMKMARQLIDSMAGDWNPKDYTDSYTGRVKKLIKAKQSGGTVTVAEEAPEATNVTDLMETLRKSVEAARSRGGLKAARKTLSSSTEDDGAVQKPAKRAAVKRTAKAAAPKRSTAKASPRKKAAPAKRATAKRSPARKAA